MNFSERLFLRKRGQKTVDKIEGIFNDLTQFYIGEHLNAFSNYCIMRVVAANCAVAVLVRWLHAEGRDF